MSTTRISGLAALALLLSGVAHAQEQEQEQEPAVGRVLELADLWAFQAGDNPAFASPGLDDTRWDVRRLPTWDTPLALRWSGYAWYRRHVELTTADLTTDLALSLGPAGEAVEVYVNGALVGQRGRFGSRPSGGPRHLAMVVHVPAKLLRAGDNVIALRVLDPTYAGGFTEGPLVLGPVDLVVPKHGEQGRWAVFARVVLALAALALAIAQLLVYRGRLVNPEVLWLGAAGLAASVWHLAGTGVISTLVPSVELAVRLPQVGGLLALALIACYGSSRFDDASTPRVRIGRLVALGFCMVALLVPESWVYLAGEAVMLVGALLVALYGAGLLLQAARRQERSSLWLFASFLALGTLVIYEGMSVTASDARPPLAAVGALGVILIATWASALEATREHDATWSKLVATERRLDEALSINILQATAMSITDARAFLRLVVQEAARELDVRRCSLVLAEPDGQLRVRAAVGLPKDAADIVVAKEGTFAGWVFTTGQPLTASTVPPELTQLRRQGQYATSGFISHPVRYADRILGVLNVSDRSDGAAFSAADAIHVDGVASKIGLVLTRLGGVASTGEPADVVAQTS